MSTIKIKEKSKGSELTVDVDKGFNAISCKLSKNNKPYEILYFKGAPILFPFANRLLLNENGDFSWRDSHGKAWNVQVLNDDLIKSNLVKDNQFKKSVRHGFACLLPFKVIKQSENSVTGKLCFSDHELLPEFYKGLEIEITHSLEDGAWKTVARIVNNSGHEMPISYCVHYWFNSKFSLECLREDCKVTIPVQKHWISENKLPTGQLEDVEGTRFDFRGGREIGKNSFYDDVFYRKSTGENFQAEIYVPKEDVSIVVDAQDDFRNVVFFVPEDQPETICIEPQTSSVDMFRMQEKGLKQETNLISLREGECFELMTKVFLE